MQMKSQDIERALSRPRFGRFVAACGGDRTAGLALYRTNIRLSFKMFAVISVFEIVFRNAIDAHYRIRFGANWLNDQLQPSGFLSARGCEKSRENVVNTIIKLGADYTHDKAVADLSFPFWRCLFASKEFMAGKSTLLSIFTEKPHGEAYNHTYVFNQLGLINEIRNRIAHHDPICFMPKTNIASSEPTLKAYHSMKELLRWLDIHPNEILAGVDFVEEEVNLYFGQLL